MDSCLIGKTAWKKEMTMGINEVVAMDSLTVPKKGLKSVAMMGIQSVERWEQQMEFAKDKPKAL
jgi:hypothetical protein